MDYLWSCYNARMCLINLCRRYYLGNIDGHVRLVHLVRLQTGTFRLFLRQQTDDEQTGNKLRKTDWASVFRLIFKNSMSPCQCLNVHISMSMSPCLCLHVHDNMSTPQCLHVQVSISPCFHASCLCYHISISPSLCLHVSMLP
jgi:hypothetical protein